MNPGSGPADVTIRPLRRGEQEPVLTVFDGMSAASRRSRFLVAMPGPLPASIAAALSAVDGRDHVCFVAEVAGVPVGVGRWQKGRASTTTADVAVAIVDDHQGRGIGTLLARHLVDAARRAGLSHLTCVHDPANTRAARLAGRFRQEPPSVSGGVVDRRLVVGLDADHATLPSSATP